MKDLKQLIAEDKDRWQRGFGDSESVKSLLLALRERVEKEMEKDAEYLRTARNPQ